MLGHIFAEIVSVSVQYTQWAIYDFKLNYCSLLFQQYTEHIWNLYVVNACEFTVNLDRFSSQTEAEEAC